MYLILKGLAEEWKPVKNLLTKKIEDIEKMFYQHYNLLCNDKIFLSNDIKKLLKCRYVHHDIPFLKIAPFKEEDIYLEPRVVMFHDVISEEEIDTMKDMSKHMLQGSEVEGVNGSYSSQVRISETTWLIDDDHKHVKNVNRRVEDMTNLALDSAEVLQITRYQVGGKYDVHYDFDIEHKMPLEIGDRIATLMFYLSDVSEGGNTIFIDLNITISPKKGNAIFWYNLRKNGDFNLLTAHSGCPVIAGTKWVANKWLNEIGQEFRRPCTWEEKPKESKYFSTISSFNLINN
ncbi:prolyl 4-hydroxylase subunit alpha-1-like [Leptopilina boulardi]|uniref:prolyl 4-hydroxylase subunit alpha-1-like n=1 Tax=Leptopilina boulardi TaxID=63433 RepID=UPI0021F532B0|nr:prolyl 4-hydroxylase subunit alpha-1-like [Leptopilina boulardi]XP_051167903.1 prolyl 4-hydroxylase subunit alpha-1-like [Leptopilina boulardi]